MSRVHELVVQRGGSKGGERYHVDGLELDAALPVDSIESLRHELSELSRGTITLSLPKG